MTKRWLIGTLTTSVLLWLCGDGTAGRQAVRRATARRGLWERPGQRLYGDGDGLYIDGVRQRESGARR